MALQIIEEDLKTQLENVKNHYNEVLSIRQEEIESLRLTGSQLREQLALRESDMIQLIQRHEDQIIKLFDNNETKTEQSDLERMVIALKDQITDIRGILVEKQNVLNTKNLKLEEQDKLVRQLQEKNLDLEDEIKKYQQMKFTDHTYQNHVDQLNQCIKDSKKKQLTSKAKTKSLEKQLGSLKESLSNEEKKTKEFQNEKLIYEQIIEKQNTLIEELRQTEKGLRESLNRFISAQDEQKIELNYWEEFKKSFLEFDKSTYSDYSFSTEPLIMIIENLENLCQDELDEKEHNIKDNINRLNSFHVSLNERINYVADLEKNADLLKSCIDRTNKINVNLNKHLSILIKEYQAHQYEIHDFVENDNNLLVEQLDQCTNEELIRKIMIISRNTVNYNEKLLHLENENLRLNLELNKIAEISTMISLEIEQSLEDIRSSLNKKTIKDDDGNRNFSEILKNNEERSSFMEQLLNKIKEESSIIKSEIETNICKINKENIKINESIQQYIIDLGWEISKMKNLSKANFETVTNEEQHLQEEHNDELDEENKEEMTRENNLLLDDLNNQLVNLKSVVEELNFNEINLKDQLSKSFEDIKKKSSEIEYLKSELVLNKREKAEKIIQEREQIAMELECVKNAFEMLEQKKTINENIFNEEIKGLRDLIENKCERENNHNIEILTMKESQNKLLEEKTLIEKEMNEKNVIIDQMTNQLQDLFRIEAQIKEDLGKTINSRDQLLMELENVKAQLTITETERDEKKNIINELNTNLLATCHEKNEIENDRNGLLKKLKDQEAIVDELNNQIKKLKSMHDNFAENEQKLKCELELIMAEKSAQIKEHQTALESLDAKKDSIISELKQDLLKKQSGLELNNQMEMAKMKKLESMEQSNAFMEKEIEDRNSKNNELIMEIVELKSNMENLVSCNTVLKEANDINDVEKEKKDRLINQLNTRLIEMENSLEEKSAKEANYNKQIAALVTDRDNMKSELNHILNNQMVIEKTNNELQQAININKNNEISVQRNYDNLLEILEKEKENKEEIVSQLNNILEEKEKLLEEKHEMETIYKNQIASILTDSDEAKQQMKKMEDELLITNQLNNELAELRSMVQSSNERECKLKEERDNLLKENQNVKIKTEIIEQQKDEKDAVIGDIKNQLIMLQNVLEEMNDRELNFKDELSMVIEERNHITKELNIAKDQIVNLEKEHNSKDNNIIELKGELNKLTTMVNELNDRNNTYQNDLSILIEDRDNAKNDLKNIKNTLTLLDAEKLEMQLAINALMENELNLKKELSERDQEKNNLSDELKIVEKEKQKNMELIDQLNERLADWDRIANETIIRETNSKAEIEKIYSNYEKANKNLEIMEKQLKDYENNVNEKDLMIEKLNNKNNENENRFMEELKRINEENNNLLSESENFKTMISTNHKIELEKENQINILKENLKEITSREEICKLNLSIITEHRDNVVQELDQMQSTIKLYQTEKDSVISELQNEIVQLKCSESRMKDERNYYLEENEMMKNERTEKDHLINELHNKLDNLTISFEEIKSKEIEYIGQLESTIENRDLISQELTSVKNIVNEKNSTISGLNDQLIELKPMLHNLSANEIQLKDEIKILTLEKKQMTHNIQMLDGEIKKKDNIVQDLNNELIQFKKSLKENNDEQFKYQHDLEVLRKEKNVILNELEDAKSSIVSLGHKIEEDGNVINELNIQVSDLKDIVRDMSDVEAGLKDQIASRTEDMKNNRVIITSLEESGKEQEKIIEEMRNKQTNFDFELSNLTEDRDKLLTELHSIKSSISVSENENGERVNVLNDQITELKCLIREFSDREIGFNDKILLMQDEIDNLIHKNTHLEELRKQNDKNITDLKIQISERKEDLELKSLEIKGLTVQINDLQKTIAFLNRQKDKNMLICDNAKKETEKMKLLVEEMNANEDLVQLKLIDLAQDKANINQQLQESQALVAMISEQNETLTKEITIVKIDNERLNSSIDETLRQKEELIKANDDQKQKFEEMEKSNLILKAKLLKLKNQSDKKINMLKKENENLLQKSLSNKSKDKSEELETVESCPQVNIPELSTYHGHLKQGSHMADTGMDQYDEKSLFHQIEHLSDHIGAKVRKINVEIEEFLEQNEKVTSSLISKSSPNHSSTCTDTQCGKLLGKNRELSASIRNLQEQNQLMKNKVVDLSQCLEREQEIYKQINEEDVRINNGLIEKLNQVTNEKIQLQTQLSRLNDELKSLKKDKQNNGEKISTLQNDLKDSLTKHSNLSQQYAELNDHFDKIKSQNEHLQSKIHSLESSIDQSKKLNKNLENDKFELRKINKQMVDEMESVRQSYRQVVDQQCNKCTVWEIENQTLNALIFDLNKTICEYLHQNRALHEKVQILETQLDEDNMFNTNLIDSSSLLLNDVDVLKSRYINQSQANETLVSQLSIILVRVEHIDFTLKELRSERQNLKLRIEMLEKENEKYSQELLAVSNSINIKIMPLSSNVLDQSHSCCLPITEQKSLIKFVFEKLDDHFSLNLKFQESEIKDNIDNVLETYIRAIKENPFNQSPINEMIDGCVQTNVDGIYLQTLDSLLKESMNEHKIDYCDDFPDSGWIRNMELYLQSINKFKHQIAKLEEDLQLEEQKKYELSDRFEQIIMELESACDAEVDKLKLSNELLNQQVQSLQTVREEQDQHLKSLRSQIMDLQLEFSKSSSTLCEKDNSNDIVPTDSNDNSLMWISNLNDALKETIAEKEDQITELMKQYNDSTNKIKEARFKEESQNLEIQDLTNTIKNISDELKIKEASIHENFDVINELEVMCVEKDNRIHSLEKELNDINIQMEQYISAVCSMQARLEASKPSMESMLSQIDSRSNSIQLLNLIDQLEKDYSEELEQCEMSKSKLEIKLNKAIQIIHKLKKQLKQSHNHIAKLNDEIKQMQSVDSCSVRKDVEVNEADKLISSPTESNAVAIDVSTQINFQDESALVREENENYKGIIENLHVNNFILWRELDNLRKSDRSIRGSSLPPGISVSKITGKAMTGESERSTSPVSQMSSNSIEGESMNFNQIKDLQRKLNRTTQQLNQMRIERNRIHQEYTRIRQLKEEGEQKIFDLMKCIDANANQENILQEKDQLVEMNNKFSAKIVELEAEMEMTKVRNSILETKCKKMEWKLNNQRRKYDVLILKLDEKEQEIERWSDDLRRNSSSFEKERLEFLREKRELKLQNKSKDEKISNFQKRLSIKCSQSNDKNDKEDTNNENTDSFYLSEIEQLRDDLSRQKSDNKRYLSQYREEITKYKGQLEELIDDNRQLKRKLSFDQPDNKKVFTDISSTNRYISGSLMQIIDEVVESSDYPSTRSIHDSNAVLAKVVLEKEQLIQLLAEKEEQLQNVKSKDISEKEDKDKSISVAMSSQNANDCHYKETNDKDQEKESLETSIKTDSTYFSVSVATSTRCYCVDNSTQTNVLYDRFIIDESSQTFTHCSDQFTQTMDNLLSSIINHHRQGQLKQLNFQKQAQIECLQARLVTNFSTQTEEKFNLDDLLNASRSISQCFVASQTDNDELINNLQCEVIEKERLKELVHIQRSKANNQISELEIKLDNAGVTISNYEHQFLEYQEVIGKLELEIIEINKKHVLEIDKLNSAIDIYKQTYKKKQSTDEIIQINESEHEDGWDMEWEYEKNLVTEHMEQIDNSEKVYNEDHVQENQCVNQHNYVSLDFLKQLENLLNTFSGDMLQKEINQLISTYSDNNYPDEVLSQTFTNNANVVQLVPILREEILKLKQTLGDRNNEIGLLKFTRNQLQSELLESGQQIKDSNMEFLNLKENIQAIKAEKDILITKLKDLEERFKQLVNFNRMIGLDLRRLRDSTFVSNDAINGNLLDEQYVNDVTQSLEHELRKLLEQMLEKDIKLENSINRIEQLSFTIHRLQLHHASNSNSEIGSNNLSDQAPHVNNEHEECQNLMVEMSELLEKKQVEIDELRSRLFLATDQLIHFRTFFADPDYKINREDKEHLASLESLNEIDVDRSQKNHTRILLESDAEGPLSDYEDQALVSSDGTTIIRVEKIARIPSTCPNTRITRFLSQLKYKNIFNHLKSTTRRLMSFRSQPRLNIKTLFIIYIIFIHLFLFRCSLF